MLEYLTPSRNELFDYEGDRPPIIADADEWYKLLVQLFIEGWTRNKPYISVIYTMSGGIPVRPHWTDLRSQALALRKTSEVNLSPAD